jgi:hypothetical protein
MNQINTGCPAFPTSEYNGCNQGEPGMTLRDYFAAAALQGFCANPNNQPMMDKHFKNLAEDALLAADFLINARSHERTA